MPLVIMSVIVTAFIVSGVSSRVTLPLLMFLMPMRPITMQGSILSPLMIMSAVVTAVIDGGVSNRTTLPLLVFLMPVRDNAMQRAIVFSLIMSVIVTAVIVGGVGRGPSLLLGGGGGPERVQHRLLSMTR